MIGGIECYWCGFVLFLKTFIEFHDRWPVWRKCYLNFKVAQLNWVRVALDCQLFYAGGG